MGMLRRYELQGCAEQPFDTLSGGQQARFQILLLERSGATLLLLDEPTDNLDLVSAEALEAGLAQFTGTVDRRHPRPLVPARLRPLRRVRRRLLGHRPPRRARRLAVTVRPSSGDGGVGERPAASAIGSSPDAVAVTSPSASMNMMYGKPVDAVGARRASARRRRRCTGHVPAHRRRATRRAGSSGASAATAVLTPTICRSSGIVARRLPLAAARGSRRCSAGTSGRGTTTISGPSSPGRSTRRTVRCRA